MAWAACRTAADLAARCVRASMERAQPARQPVIEKFSDRLDGLQCFSVNCGIPLELTVWENGGEGLCPTQLISNRLRGIHSVAKLTIGQVERCE